MTLKNVRMKHPLLTVIVPIYNAESYLDHCIASILNQNYKNMEIILVNDGSTDGSLQICKKYQEQDDRIKVISKENGGLIRARKAGLKEAKGTLIGFVDSDDWIEADMYEQLVKYMQETGCDLVTSGFIKEQEDSGQTDVVFDHYEEGLYTDLEVAVYPTMLYDSQSRDFGMHCSLWTKIFRKDLLERVYADINEEVFYGEDALAFYPYCLSINSIFVLKKAFYHYTIRSGSMCRVADERLPYNNYQLYKGLKKVFSTMKCRWVLMRQLKQYVLLLEKHSLLWLYQINTESMGEWQFSYSEEVFEKKFVIYGAGACGQALFEKVRQQGKYKNMVFWIDKEAEIKMEECNHPLYKPEALIGAEWEIILVAVKNGKLAEQIKKELSEKYQIDHEKICWSPVQSSMVLI